MTKPKYKINDSVVYCQIVFKIIGIEDGLYRLDNNSIPLIKEEELELAHRMWSAPTGQKRGTKTY